MALYLLALLLLALPIAMLCLGGLAVLRLLRGARLIVAEFHAEPREARPGETIRVRAHVVSRRATALEVTASLDCTLFDHRARRLFSRKIALAALADGRGKVSGELELPPQALGTGIIGDELSQLFSEEARRLLASWTVVFEVHELDRRGRRTLLVRKARPVEVVGGRHLSTDERFLGQLVVDTFASLKHEMVFNWLVQMAARDGHICAGEQELLREVLKTAHGVTDVAVADARILAERHRKLDLDPELLRRHVPAGQRVEFYKLMFAVAWRDGELDPREQEFLLETMRGFGLDRHHVREVELEVLRDVAAHSMG